MSDKSKDQLTDQREQGFYIVDDEVIDDHGAKIGPLGVAIYNVLVRHANKFGASCFPSYQTIANKLGVSRTTAIKGVEVLIKEKLVRKEARTDEDGDAASNNYKILPIKKHKKPATGVVQNLDHPPGLSDAGGTDFVLPLVQNLDQGGTDSVPEPDPSNQTHLNQTNTHTPARAPSSSNGKAVCVCSTPHRSKICDEERIRIATNMPGVTFPERYAMTSEARRGTYDAAFLKRQREIQKPEIVNLPERDASACPDCHGKVPYYPAGDTPEGRAKGVKKCTHPRLDEALQQLQEEYEQNREELSTP